MSLRQNLVGGWCPSLGPTAGTLLDRSPRRNHGTLTNMDPSTDWVADGGKWALDFDGIDDRVEIGTTVNASPTGLTIAAWASSPNWSLSGGGNGVFATKGSLQGDSTSTFALYYNVSLGWSFFTLSSGNVLSIIRDSTTTATANKLFFIAGTATASTLSIYVDGVLKNTAANSGGDIKTGTQTLNIGSDNVSRRMYGKIFDIAIFERAITATEVAALYRLGRGGIYQQQRRTRYPSTRRFRRRQYAQLVGGGIV